MIDGSSRGVLREQRALASRSLREQQDSYGRSLAEHELVALWLLGRVPASVLPWPLLRAGRAGRGPGPDVREAAFQHPSGVPLAGDLEVHLRASDFVRHGHDTDPGYDGLILHLVWEDDREADAGTPTPLPNGGRVLTVAVAPALDHDAAALRELIRLGPSGGESCAAGRPPRLPRRSPRPSAAKAAAASPSAPGAPGGWSSWPAGRARGKSC